MKPLFLTLFTLAFAGSLCAQNLIINELSQGTGSAEYVEFVVGGATSCTNVPCINLRKQIFDDNNGNFGTAGVSQGAMRFADVPFWSCIPQGTLIVLYNAANRNFSLPADDLSMSDGNSRLIIPSNSALFEKTTASPTGGLLPNQTYPTDVQWTGGGDWSTIGMADGGDAFQVVSNNLGINPNHSVSWGSAATNPIIYFAGSAANKIFAFVNSTNDNASLQANWIVGATGMDETPGLPNSPENEDWINRISRMHGTAQVLGMNIWAQDESCQTLCDGSAMTQSQNGYGAVTYVWSTGDTTSVISGLCPGTYTVELTDELGCTIIDSVEVMGGVLPGQSGFNEPDTLSEHDQPYTYTPSSSSNGKWEADCGACVDSVSGVFDPYISGPGIFTVCHIVGSGPCADTTCKTQVVRGDCKQQPTFQTIEICDDESADVFGKKINFEGKFMQLYVDQNGCDSMSTILVYRKVCSEKDADGLATIPNVFSPNGDGVNDGLTIRATTGQILNATIHNRWGQEVWRFSDQRDTWYGHDQMGNKLAAGVYFYQIDYLNTIGERKRRNGFLTIVE